MVYFVLGLLVLGLFLLFANSFVKADPKKLAATVRKAGGFGLLGLAALMALTGRFILAVPVAGFAMMLLSRGTALGNMFQGGFPDFGLGRPSGGQTSRVRTATLEMTLEHDSGAMDGTVLAGQYSGAQLSALGLEELISLHRECMRQDMRAGQLLEAYLDRNHSGWRERAGPGAKSEGAASASDPMTVEEAYEILGLQPGAKHSEIRAAHRALMKKLHPDQGGSTYLATKVNEAKDILLRLA